MRRRERQHSVCLSLLAACLAGLLLSTSNAAGAAASVSDLPSGKPIEVASESYLDKVQGVASPSLSAGVVTKPVGYGNVFGGKLPDLFLANSDESTHPGLFLYQYLSTDGEGAPKFRRRLQVTHPFKGLLPPPGHVVEHNGTIHGFWIVEGNIVAHTRYDRAIHGFVDRREMHVLGLPRPPTSVLYLPEGEERGELVFEVPDRETPGVLSALDAEGDRFRRMPYNPKDGLEGNYPRDSTGMWRVRPVYSSLFGVHISQFTASPSHSARKLTQTDHDMEYGYTGISGFVTEEEEGRRTSIVAGSHYGGLYLFQGHISASSFSVLPRQPLKSAARSNVYSRALKSPSPLPVPMAYPSKRGYTNMLVGGEGSLQFYKFLGFSKDTFMPLYSQPKPVVEAEAMIYGGSHPAVNVVDWDRDGRKDIVAGNAEGRILFFKNAGTDVAPRFLAGIPLLSCVVEVKSSRAKVHRGLLREVRAKAGYQALNGPAESAYGYATPSVVDWDNDGFPDIIMTDALGTHTLHLNAGFTGRVPILQPGIKIFCNDKEMQGPWRVKPGVAKYQRRLMYVAIDAANHLHAYYKMDNQNLKDAGKLKLADGKFINTHYLLGSAVGRIHINLVDFDADGVLDLILAVPAHASVPEANEGIPQSLGLPGGAVLFLKGRQQPDSRGPPVFSFPEVVHHDGHPLFIGREDGSVAVTDIGKTAGPHLLVGEEGGRIVFYDRMHLSCKTYDRFPVRSSTASDVESQTAMSRKELESYLRPEWESLKDLDISLVPELLQGSSSSPEEEDFLDPRGRRGFGTFLGHSIKGVDVLLFAGVLAGVYFGITSRMRHALRREERSL
ncbi:hypothetical protein HOP50_10g59590 [Chloropicon primus]|uniref:FG-GAP repeat domain-containing protein n=1 Tax=Chloropicon primus TaxID=1764295 RepID=A0A5B8MVG5_9CHLO|nr:hypothetical protein A3770_10p59380 [Chloropicon primus]UPR02632.1 hypothetical protein HOP50_10g59590 [Chloropicon primus]|eukprot:QDZ23420.1 hypothetical protein A3770_10p59380 [Chloropicon primus]